MINDKVASELVDALLREIIRNIHVNKNKIKRVAQQTGAGIFQLISSGATQIK